MIGEKVDRPHEPPRGFGMVVGGALMSAYVLIFSVFYEIQLVWTVVLLSAAVSFAIAGMRTAYRSAPPGADRSESWALTTDAIWHRRGADGHWQLLIPLSSIQRLETGYDDARMVAPNCGATIRVFDDRGAVLSVGPVHNPLRWTRLVVELGAKRGAQIKTFDWPWVPIYEPYVEDETAN